MINFFPFFIYLIILIMINIIFFRDVIYIYILNIVIKITFNYYKEKQCSKYSLISFKSF